jgi:hypothetical protein
LAWALGLGLASLMMGLVVFNDVRGPINIIVCLICIILLFFETAFGICLGCKLYNILNKETAQLCPGGVCEIKQKENIQIVGKGQIFALLAFIALFTFILNITHFNSAATPPLESSYTPGNNISMAEQERCTVPKFAQLIGHEKQWKQHNGCP